MAYWIYDTESVYVGDERELCPAFAEDLVEFYFDGYAVYVFSIPSHEQYINSPCKGSLLAFLSLSTSQGVLSYEENVPDCLGQFQIPKLEANSCTPCRNMYQRLI